ncbi:hypothetical protein BDB00DRAFT_970411 [Zychaea mexicana]|uniref:uncharacterized protein n=1 Tax=Zychaea mexicana TaxID=64656 RepID=UPI0022FEC845|nr:uncharacterized protein BDB00DRAFT_970411 [Zychaea mexicana]KAI9497199.1 hypothetical protein BDB00DRAFT_970411 [Zychaea mexicana]
MRSSFATRLLCLILGVSLPLVVKATPAWNEVNGFDVFGNRCELPTYNQYPCSNICARDISQCPESVRPSCPEGQTYCVDGECRDNCPSDLKSACSCTFEDSFVGDVYPCATGQRVNIEHFLATNLTAQTAEACALDLGIEVDSVVQWTNNPASLMWNTCPSPSGELTFHEPAFIALYVFYGSCAAMLIGWTLYKQALEKYNMSKFNQYARQRQSEHVEVVGEKKDSDSEKKPDVAGKSGDNASINMSSSLEPEEQMVIKAYKRDFLGMFCFLLYILQTLGMVAYMIMLTWDYYNEYILFGGNQLVQSSTFIGMWYIFFGWFGCLSVFKNRLMNFFRIKCAYAEAKCYTLYILFSIATIFLQDRSDKITDSVRWLEQHARRIFGLDVVITTSAMRSTRSGARFFVYQCTRYVYHPETQIFTPHEFVLGETNADMAELKKGLSADEAVKREELVGPNFINVYVPNIAMAVLREFSSFFYTYQFTALWLFYYFAYWEVGVADTAVILLSAFVKVFVRLRSERRIKKMAEFTDSINILRDGTWQELSTADMVPGDIFEVADGKTVPCDAVVLTGNIVVDESSLTGEPLPIRKFPVRSDDSTTYDRMGSSKISTIFCGTTISQAQPTEQGGRVTAVATQTGTGTDKGELVKKILFPSPVSFIFNEQIKITILILLCCGLVCLGLAIWLYATGTSAWLYAMFAIAQLISPLLPAALVIGQSVSAGRLRSKQIFCVDLPRILMAGKVQLFCFDKTGTLTREGLDYYGAQPVADLENVVDAQSNSSKGKTGPPAFDKRVDTVAEVPRLMQIGLATCHAVTTLNGQFIGNPVDIEMFRSSEWKLEESGDDVVDTLSPPATAEIKTPVDVLKRFEFVHARMSMSVAVLDRHTNKVHIFVKGAYEKIKELSNSESIPADYDKTTSNLAREGCYVLALAHRELDLEQIGGIEAFRNWSRDQMEEEIHFMGLIVFKNQLKDDTTENITELKNGATRTIMITGDTALTGVFIARQCGMALPNSRILLGDVDKVSNRLVWQDVDEPETFSDVNVDDYLLNKEHTPVELAVTGKAFQWLVDNNLIRKYLLDIRVFARMTPTGKVQCVQLHMERGITAMTGDGGNDCGALRAAHVGIAMSDAEASIVSPFSTSIRSVRSCVELLLQGRAALATSITAYKYLIMYGQVMMMMKIFTFYFSVTMAQYVWIAIDVFITVFLTWAVTQSRAADNLNEERPTARLLGPQTMASCLGLVSINWIFMSCIFKFLYSQDWFRCNEFDSNAADLSKWWLLADNYEAEHLALVSLFMFINNAAVFSFGHKFRQPIYKNYPLLFLWALYMAILSYWMLGDPNRFGCLFRINCGTKEVLAQFNWPVPPTNVEQFNTPLGHNVMPWEYRWKLWGICVANVACCLIYERFFVLGPVRKFLSKKYPVQRLKITQ